MTHTTKKAKKNTKRLVPATIKVDGIYYDYLFTWGKIYYDSADTSEHTEPNTPEGIKRLIVFQVGKELVSQRRPEQSLEGCYGY